MKPNSTRKLKVAMIIFDQFKILDLTGPMDVLSDQCIPAKNKYQIDVMSVNGGLVKSSGGLAVDSIAFKSLQGYDSLMVIGGQGVIGAISNQKIINYIREQSSHVNRVVSICTGAFLLAKAGLLENKKAATHWRSADDLQQLFPNIEVCPDDIYVKDDKIYTSAGVTAGIDLTLSLVADDLGHKIAMDVAKNLVVYYHRPGGQKQFSNQLQAQVKNQPQFENVLLHIESQLHQNIQVEHLAEIANMSGRHFSRQFSAQVGMAPGKYVEQVRVERMKQLLENTSTSLPKMAQQTGFASIDVMRRVFVRHLGVTPNEYRQNFSTIST